jgi:hypothetical protein
MTTHEYYTKNKEICSLKFKNWYNKNKEWMREYKQQYNKSHKNELREWNKYYYNLHKEDVKNRVNEWRMKHPEKVSEQNSIRRNMGFNILIQNPFPDSIKIHWHHINDNDVIPIQKEIHSFCYTGRDKNKHKELVNEWVTYLYSIYLKGYGE